MRAMKRTLVTATPAAQAPIRPRGLQQPPATEIDPFMHYLLSPQPNRLRHCPHNHMQRNMEHQHHHTGHVVQSSCSNAAPTHSLCAAAICTQIPRKPAETLAADSTPQRLQQPLYQQQLNVSAATHSAPLLCTRRHNCQPGCNTSLSSVSISCSPFASLQGSRQQHLAAATCAPKQGSKGGLCANTLPGRSPTRGTASFQSPLQAQCSSTSVTLASISI